ILWADWMIDWPRRDVMRHMLARPNLALVARRQMPPTGACSHFWITDTIALDGLVRSDNRGSESVFPLWLDTGSATGQANLAQEFVAAIAAELGLTWDECGTSSAKGQFGPVDVLHYIYGLFNSPTYRLRYCESLRRDFPRVLIPKHRLIWTAFRDIGERLAKLHLMECVTVDESPTAPGDSSRLGTGYPKFANGRIWLNNQGPSVLANERIWNFHVGTHQVCRKWLRDRGAFGAKTLSRYGRIVAAIEETLELTDRLDAVVAEVGGWDAAFST
ncbi:MAG: type ISP restriction/modification enzyme, partial [Planctomycetota bacterium]